MLPTSIRPQPQTPPKSIRNSVTLNELSEAKVLILDLLGWGLSPENLVEAGISKHCLVPCLRELKLRLPTNIDLSDVVLYDPPMDRTSSLMSNESPENGVARMMNTGDHEESSDAIPLSSPSKRKRRNMANHQARASLPSSSAIPSAPGEQAASLLQRLQTTGQPDSEAGHMSNVNSSRHRSLPPPLTDNNPSAPSGGRGLKKPGKNNFGRGRWSSGRGRGFGGGVRVLCFGLSRLTLRYVTGHCFWYTDSP
jgi:hypothetical protein